jgi:TatD DNase family protein
MWKYIDIHSHLNFPEYDADREEVIARMKELGVATITVGTSLETSQSAVALAEQHDNIFACIGIHPIDDPSSVFDEKEFEKLVSHPKVVAIGECGLDYGREGNMSEEQKKTQAELFIKQIEFAVKHDKPIMIHARNTHVDILEMLKTKKAEHGETLRGNVHFFSGTLEEALAYHSLDFSTSFTGVITFAREYSKLVREIPFDQMMSETDAPFVAPIPYRGRRNEPSYVIEVVRKIAEIKGLDEEIVREALIKTAVAKFKCV